MPLIRRQRRVRLPVCLALLVVLSDRTNAQFQSLSLSRGTRFACGLTNEGRIYCWGDNHEGQLGIGRVGGHRSSPGLVAFSRPVQAVTLGNDYACALQEGRAFCWGTNRNGQLADNSHIVARPTPRPTKGNLRFRLLTAGDGFTCGIAVTEQTYCWGATGDGQLGAGIKSDSVHGALLVRGDHRFRMLSAGPGSTVCGIGEENHAYCWGDLARDTTGPMSDVPVRVSGALSFQDVSVGNSFACGLTTDSLAYCWGFDGQGSLGDSGKTAGGYAATPVAVAGGMRFKSISAGSRTACALDAHGRGYCWGWNEYGQVGDGTIVNRTVPTPISGGYVFREVRAGGSTTCGITFGGETMCWGRGADGELGNGASSGRSLRPVRVIDPSP